MNVYLDYAATTPLHREVLKKMQPYLLKTFGNPDSLHSFGREAAYAVSCARDRVAGVLGVSAQEVYFTSGGTEADNWAIRTLRAKGKNGVAVSAIEHHAVLGACDHVRGKAEVVLIQPDNAGMVSADAVKRAITPDTGLVAVMGVNNETGVVQPIKEIATVCKEAGVLLFADCVQAGCTQNLKELASVCDAISLSSHKLYGPKGVGALMVKKGVKLSPLLSGGEQERGMRGGTLNVAGIVGFSYALERAQNNRERFCATTKALRDRLERELISALGDAIKVDGREAERVPNVSHITFRGAGGETLLHRLDLAGVALSGGAACAAHSALPSHVMLAMGRGEKEAKSGVRFSLGEDTNEEEISYAIAQTVACLLK